MEFIADSPHKCHPSAVCTLANHFIEVTAYIHRCNYRQRRNLLFSVPDLDKSPISRAYLSGRKRESEASNFFGAVSKLFILWAK